MPLDSTSLGIARQEPSPLEPMQKFIWVIFYGVRQTHKRRIPKVHDGKPRRLTMNLLFTACRSTRIGVSIFQ